MNSETPHTMGTAVEMQVFITQILKERDQLRADLEATGRVVLARDSTINQLRAELDLARKCVEAMRLQDHDVDLYLAAYDKHKQENP